MEGGFGGTSASPLPASRAQALEIDDGVDEGTPRFAWSLAVVLALGYSPLGAKPWPVAGEGGRGRRRREDLAPGAAAEIPI